MNDEIMKEVRMKHMREGYSEEVIASLMLVERFDKLCQRLDDIGKILQNRL